jgi:hypothetical protein
VNRTGLATISEHVAREERAGVAEPTGAEVHRCERREDRALERRLDGYRAAADHGDQPVGLAQVALDHAAERDRLVDKDDHRVEPLVERDPGMRLDYAERFEVVRAAAQAQRGARLDLRVAVAPRRWLRGLAGLEQDVDVAGRREVGRDRLRRGRGQHGVGVDRPEHAARRCGGQRYGGEHRAGHGRAVAQRDLRRAVDVADHRVDADLRPTGAHVLDWLTRDDAIAELQRATGADHEPTCVTAEWQCQRARRRSRGLRSPILGAVRLAARVIATPARNP